LRAETRALGRALAALGIGTQFVGQDLSEGEHIADAPVARPVTSPVDAPTTGDATPEASRISQDEARELKRLAQAAWGYRVGEANLRAALGFEVDEPLTLRHLAAHVTAAQYARLRADYEAAVRREVDADVPGSPETRQGSHTSLSVFVTVGERCSARERAQKSPGPSQDGPGLCLMPRRRNVRLPARAGRRICGCGAWCARRQPRCLPGNGNPPGFRAF
jgi:hypothetical protein